MLRIMLCICVVRLKGIIENVCEVVYFLYIFCCLSFKSSTPCFTQSGQPTSALSTSKASQMGIFLYFQRRSGRAATARVHLFPGSDPQVCFCGWWKVFSRLEGDLQVSTQILTKVVSPSLDLG